MADEKHPRRASAVPQSDNTGALDYASKEPTEPQFPMRLRAIAVIGVVIGMLALAGNVIELCMFGSWMWDALVQTKQWVTPPLETPMPSAAPSNPVPVTLPKPQEPHLDAWRSSILMLAHMLAIACNIILIVASRKIIIEKEDALQWAFRYGVIEMVAAVIITALAYAWAEDIVFDFYHTSSADTISIFRTGIVAGLILAFAWALAVISTVRSRSTRAYWSTLYPGPEFYSKLIVRQSYP